MNDWHQRPEAWTGDAAIRPEAALLADIEYSLAALAGGDDAALLQPRLQACRAAIHRMLEQGSGALAFASQTLRDLPQQAFYRTFQAWCRWLGMPVSINLRGDTLKEVRDEGVADSLMAPQRGHMTNQELAFHSDRADITCLACWSPAASGGEFRVVSSSWVVGWIADRHPDLLSRLAQPLPHDLRGEGCEDYIQLPILSNSQAGFVFRYIRKFNESVLRHGVQLPADAVSLLDAVDEAVNQPGIAAEVVFDKGVVALCNNHTTLHSRHAFRDDEAHRRCLLRCWLASEHTRPLPQAFLPLFHDVRPGVLRGGVKQAAVA
ncbi:TauD/TfdA family dioxygenase [Chromobacterium amazonense]|uniref:TauD/TfdA family dioxygenase n=1 Tax=Chromobacterium amazonense TaxID=1382803 RepID=UPI0031F6B21B